MSFALYKLDGDLRPVLLCTRPADREGLLAWAKWMAKAQDRGILQIAKDDCGGVEVFTVFLGVNLNTAATGRPLVFETAMFRDGNCTVIGRSATIEEAQSLHARTVSVLQATHKRQDASTRRAAPQG